MPTLMTIIHFIVALNLLGAALAGAVHTKLPRKVPNLSFFYFGWSLTGQAFAGPIAIMTLVSLYFAASGITPSFLIVIINIVTLMLIAIILVRSWLASVTLAQIDSDTPRPSFLRFVLGTMFPMRLRPRTVQKVKNISYGSNGRKNQLDIYSLREPSSTPRPVLINVHGGGWVIGRKGFQARPLIHYMASQGWLVVDINYRLGPWNRMPAMVQDVLRSVAWVKENIGTYRGDPNFVALTGGSAGGHLVALASLAHDVTALKPGFEESDCSVNACVPVYGLYDLLDKNEAMKGGTEELQSFLSRLVMPGPPSTHEQVWTLVSPIHHIRVDAPPMLLLHGRHDALADFVSAQAFANSLDQVSHNVVTFAALMAGQHGYDCVHAGPTPEHVRAVHRFLKKVREI